MDVNNIEHKAKLTTDRGTFEFSGSQKYVEEQVEKITNMLEKNPHPQVSQVKEDINFKPTKPKQASSALRDNPELIEDLFGKKLLEARAFIEKKKPSGHMERFLAIAYWLRENLDVKEVNIDHMYTGYKLLGGAKPPKAFNQVLRDAKSKKAWFNKGSQVGFYKVSIAGESHVEHDLPATESNGN